MAETAAQIIGFRKDRLGARIIALGNLLSLEDKYGASVSFLWADKSEDHDMRIDDPNHPIFDREFAAKYLEQIAQGDRTKMEGLTDLEEIRGRISTQLFQDKLKTNERFLCMNGFQPLLFANEVGPDQMDAFRAAMARIVWAPQVQDVLEQATVKLSALSEETYAVHVRRGDVLDKEPWCHRHWPAKFAPDEFYTAIMNQPDVATLLFSDTPEVADRLAAGHPNAITFSDLVDAPDLSALQRDLVELLLMSHCKTICAPALSAFSSSAAMVSGSRTLKLPADLATGPKALAYDALLARVLSGPDSFHNTGDFAQSLGYAYRHALNTDQYHAIYDVLNSAIAAGQGYSFYYPIVMALAIACEQPKEALVAYEHSKKDPHIWASDRLICNAFSHLAAHISGEKENALSGFLALYFARTKSEPALDAVAHYFHQNEQGVRDLFQLDPEVFDTFCTPGKSSSHYFPASETLYGGALNAALPIWILGADWTEMFDKPSLARNLSNTPSFKEKKSAFPKDIHAAELNHFRDGTALPTDHQSVMLLSVYAVALRLSGRYKRATSLLFHCRNEMPEHPVFRKRLADQLMTTGRVDAARRNFDKLGNLLPRHAGVTLARAKMAIHDNDPGKAAKLFEVNADQPLLPFTYFKAWEQAMRKINDPSGAKDVIETAAKLFPDHPVFKRKWADHL